MYINVLNHKSSLNWNEDDFKVGMVWSIVHLAHIICVTILSIICLPDDKLGNYHKGQPSQSVSVSLSCENLRWMKILFDNSCYCEWNCDYTVKGTRYLTFMNVCWGMLSFYLTTIHTSVTFMFPISVIKQINFSSWLKKAPVKKYIFSQISSKFNPVSWGSKLHPPVTWHWWEYSSK